MISTQPSSSFTSSQAAFLQDQGVELKRCHVSKRAPLNPLSATDLERRNRPSHSSGSASSRHFFVTDLRALLPEQAVSSGARPHDTFSAPVCSWPPLAPVVGSGTPSHSNPVRPPSSDSEISSRATFLQSTSTWNLPDVFQTEPTTKSMRTPSWKSENLQPIRSRTNSMPSVRRPPTELWQSDSAPAKAIHAPVDAVNSSHPTPPGLPPRHPDLRCSGSEPDLHSRGSLSLSLALGSQPLRASEPTKAVPPIGAERSRVVSTIPHRNSSATQPHSPWSPPSPRLQTKWKNNIYLLDTRSLEKAQALAGDSSTSKEDLECLLRHAVRNKYAPKIISPLSPLRTVTPACDVSTDPEYQLRMPSLSNNPSPRYSKRPPKRVRTVCDNHQTLDWDTTSMHCEECKRDTIGKRLLAFRYRQQQSHYTQRTKLHAFSPREASVYAGVDDERIALAGRIREVFAYAIDEEEKSLWEEIAAVTGAGPLPLMRVGAPCASAATFERGVDDGTSESYNSYLEIPDSAFRTTESVTLFGEVTVY